jgi:NTP pyrophosphatase (non-canonical NTP hydrolase)
MNYTLTELRNRALAIAVSKGFTDASPVEDIALIHSEASEALEDIRCGKRLSMLDYEEDGKPIGVPSEMADIIIRVLHFCGKHKIDIEFAVLEKMKYNENRPYKHNKTI